MWGTEDKYVSAITNTPSKDSSGHSDYLKVRFPREHNVPAFLEEVRKNHFPHLRSNADMVRAAVNLLIAWIPDNEDLVKEATSSIVKSHLARTQAEFISQQMKQNKEDVSNAKERLREADSDGKHRELQELVKYYDQLAEAMNGIQKEELLDILDRYRTD